MAQKILIAEDERPLAKALELKLRAAGFDVSVATDGKQALEMASGGQYDLLLLDLIMPITDGFKVLEGLHDAKVKTRVIVLSNLGQEEDMQRVKALGAVDYFVKADTPLATIIEHVQKYLG
jgi:DNA-binding response OmpR family regulator